MVETPRILDSSIRRAGTEPWYVSSRASTRDRYEQCLRLIRRHCPRVSLAYDVGCAQGQFAARLAETAARVVGIDRLPERIAHNRGAYLHLGNLSFLEGDFLNLNLPENSADLVTALEILYYFSPDERPRLLEKARALLKPGGHLLISNNIFARPGGLSQEDFTALAARYFTVTDTRAIYRGLYYRLELPLIEFLDEINYLEKLRLFSPHILFINRRFYPGRWNRWLLTPSRMMDRAALPLARRLALGLLKSRIIYRSLTFWGKTFRPESSRTQLLVLARKES
jgi:SAM-dependent methyltransferase